MPILNKVSTSNAEYQLVHLQRVDSTDSNKQTQRIVRLS